MLIIKTVKPVYNNHPWWLLYRGGRSLDVFQSKLVFELGWPLLTGGHYSEVAINTGLTVQLNSVVLNLDITNSRL
jgi:hypothetical protein